MGVDYTAFVAFGVCIKAGATTVDDLESKNRLLSKHHVGYASFGSSYSGDGGVMLVLSERHIEVDMRREAEAKPLPRDCDWNQVDGVARLFAVRDAFRDAGVTLELEGEPGWYVCGHVW